MKKRLLRILPTWWIFLIALYLIRFIYIKVNLGVMLGDFLCLSYFNELTTESAFNWYICGMWIMYLLVPYSYAIIQNYKEKSIWLTVILFVMSIAFWHSDNFILTATRLPVFFIGMYYEQKALANEELTGKGAIKAIWFIYHWLYDSGSDPFINYR